MELILNTVRKIDYDQTKELTFGNTQSLEEHLAIAFLNPKDLNDLKFTKNTRLKMTNEDRSIIVKTIEDENTPEGNVLMPVSIWANQLTQVRENEIHYKNIKVKVEVTDESITEYKDLITRIKGD